MTHDRIVVYSNGIADHRRHFDVSPGETRRIDLAVRRDHLADVLASLNVFGDVTLSAPPSFQPADADAGNVAIDTSNALEALARGLSGSRVEIERPAGNVRGTLVGLQESERGTAGEPVTAKSVVVQTEIGVRHVPLDEVTNLHFEDETVRDEIAKALRRNFERIKPHSTFVELELTGPDSGEPAEAVVQYTLPAAAWKIAYRLRELDDARYELQGFAVVTNDTDEDWKDVLVSVVTGEPITFSTDIAETKVPRRKHVDVVRNAAIGNVEVEEAYDFAEASDGMAPAAAVFDAADGDAEVVRMGALSSVRKFDPGLQARVARAQSAKATEVGDFSVFESSTPVTIAARRSAVIPMFLVTLDESKTVLHYRHVNHAERPFRAVDFTNRTEHSLGRGVCTVYQQGVYAGSCVMPALKPGADRLLPHALETGVRVHWKQEAGERTLVTVRISDGVVRSGEHEVGSTVYRVRSHRDEPYRFVLDHDRRYPDDVSTATITRNDADDELEATSTREDGPRYEFTLQPREEVEIEVVDSRVRRSTVNLVRDSGHNVGWLSEFLVEKDGPLADHEGVLRCIAVKSRLDEKRQEVDEARQRIDRLAARQERLRENVKAAGDGEQAAQWRSDLADAETELTELEETTIPALETEAKVIDRELRTALESLSAEWGV